MALHFRFLTKKKCHPLKYMCGVLKNKYNNFNAVPRMPYVQITWCLVYVYLVTLGGQIKGILLRYVKISNFFIISHR